MIDRFLFPISFCFLPLAVVLFLLPAVQTKHKTSIFGGSVRERLVFQFPLRSEYYFFVYDALDMQRDGTRRTELKGVGCR